MAVAVDEGVAEAVALAVAEALAVALAEGDALGDADRVRVARPKIASYRERERADQTSEGSARPSGTSFWRS